ERLLVEGGLLVLYGYQAYLNREMATLDNYLSYRWTAAFEWGGDANWRRNERTREQPDHRRGVPGPVRRNGHDHHRRDDRSPDRRGGVQAASVWAGVAAVRPRHIPGTRRQH